MAAFLRRAIKVNSNKPNSAAEVNTMVAAEEMSSEKLKNIPAAPQNAPISGETINKV